MHLLTKIWAIWAYFVFVILLLLTFPFYLFFLVFFPKKSLPKLLWFTHHIYFKIVFILTLVKVEVHGKELLDIDESYIIVSNHRSSFDFLLNAIAYPGIYRYLAKSELSKIPLLGFIIKKFCVLVDRSSVQSRAKSVLYLKKVLDDGMSVFLYPEGTRNRTAAPLASFQKGAFRLAIQTQRPIAIQTIVNVSDITSTTKSVDLMPGVVYVIWDKPIETKGLTLKDVAFLEQKVRSIMEARLQSNPSFLRNQWN